MSITFLDFVDNGVLSEDTVTGSREALGLRAFVIWICCGCMVDSGKQTDKKILSYAREYPGRICP